ncbi:MAG: glycosyltransferase [Chitinivibrionales bacterium]|nr:glycosyltransferase [Chitinivibrionales bacterium]
MMYSVVIPVFNSRDTVSATIADVRAFFESRNEEFEIILVNDGSRDDSWEIIRREASHDARLTAINFIKNYGQHNAVLCGMANARGEHVITMDDDGQNPAAEIRHIIDKAGEGHDVVFGEFEHKMHGIMRRLGSRIVDRLNRKIFGKPQDLVLTNFRIIKRDVVDRVLATGAGHPYIPGLLLMHASSLANVRVRHESRTTGKSNYTPYRIASLVARLLFNYSSYPLRLCTTVGFTVSLLSFTAGCFYLGRALLVGTSAPGFPTIVILLSFLNGFVIMLLGMMGEYVIRILTQTSGYPSYIVKEKYRRGAT